MCKDMVITFEFLFFPLLLLLQSLPRRMDGLACQGLAQNDFLKIISKDHNLYNARFIMKIQAGTSLEWSKERLS